VASRATRAARRTAVASARLGGSVSTAELCAISVVGRWVSLRLINPGA